MKNKGIRLACAFLSALLLAALLSGCSASKSSYESSVQNYAVSPSQTADKQTSYDTAAEAETTDTAAEAETATAEESGASGGGLSLPAGNRKVILTADVSLEAKEFDPALASLLSAVESRGGYISSREDYGTEYKNVYLTVRIPSDRFDDFLSGLSDVANLVHLSQSSEDITESYLQTESYLSSLETQQTRLLELLAQAENLEDLLSIEDRLADVRAQLQYYASLKNSYDSQINYSTVSIELSQVVDYTVLEPTFGEELLSTLKSTGINFVQFLQNLVLFLITAFPYLVLLCGMVALVWALRRRKAGRNSKKAEIKTGLTPEPQPEATEGKGLETPGEQLGKPHHGS